MMKHFQQSTTNPESISKINSLTSNGSAATAATLTHQSHGGSSFIAAVTPSNSNNSHAAMMAARKGNHRRTKSTHPDELNKMMLSMVGNNATIAESSGL